MAPNFALNWKTLPLSINSLETAFNKLQLAVDTNPGPIVFRRLAQFHATAFLPKHRLNGVWDGELELLTGQYTILATTFISRYSFDLWQTSSADVESRDGLARAVEDYFCLIIQLPIPADAAHEDVNKLLGGTRPRRASVGTFQSPPEHPFSCIMESCTCAFDTYVKLSDHIEKMHLSD